VTRLPPHRLPLASEYLDEPAKVQRQLVGWFGALRLISSRRAGWQVAP
jgi:hypothetical protein